MVPAVTKVCGEDQAIAQKEVDRPQLANGCGAAADASACTQAQRNSKAGKKQEETVPFHTRQTERQIFLLLAGGAIDP